MEPSRCLLAVSGTLQEGFELRKNLDYPGAPAVFIGDAVVRGVKAHLDVKDPGCREYAAPPSRARVNPACVVTGDRADANLYAVYLVDERAVLRALIGEPRYLSIAPDSVRVDLASSHTSDSVKALLRAAARRLDPSSAAPPEEACILTVLSTYAAPSLVPLPKALASGTLSSFPSGLAAFAGVDEARVREAGVADAALRAAEASLDARALGAAQTVLCSTTADGGLLTLPPPAVGVPRLAAAWDAPTVGSLARAAGFAESGEPHLAALAGGGATAAGAAPVVQIGVSAAPSPFTWPRGKLALVMVDWQRDFLDATGFGAALGNDVTPLRRALGPAARVLAAAREAGVPVVHTLEAHAADLSDCPPAKKRRCAAIGETLPSDPARGRVLVKGEPGNAIVPEVAPLPGEIVIHKPGKGAFCGTTLASELAALGATHLLFTGVTTEVCVQTTMREANDRGFDCLLVSDATESYFPEFKAATLAMVVAQGGIVGWCAEAAEVCVALKAAGSGGK